MLYRYRRLIIFFVCTSFVGAFFYVYQDDYYHWSCVEEDNSASCYIIGKKLNEQNKVELALNYLKKSCNLGYQKACELVKN